MPKHFRFLSLVTLFASLNSFAQVDQQLSVKEFKNLSNEAKSMIKNFTLTKEIGDVGAPEYKFIREKMRNILNKKPQELEAFLTSFNNEIADDYKIIQSVKDLGKGSAIKQTVEVAKKRFERKAKSFERAYQNVLADFVLKDLKDLEKECLTVLCINQVREDLKAWYKQASKVNRNLKLDGVSLKKSPTIKERTKKSLEHISDYALNSGKLVALQSSSEDFKNLADPRLTKEEITSYKIEDVRKRGVLKLREENAPCYETSLVSEMQIELNNVQKSDFPSLPIIELKDGNLLASDKAFFYFINPDGSLKSKVKKEAETYYTAPIELDNGRIAVLAKEGDILFFDRDGKVLESYNKKYGKDKEDVGFTSIQKLPNGTLIAKNSQKLHLINPIGERLSESTNRRAAYGSAVAMKNGEILIQTIDREIIYLDKQGKEKSTHSHNNYWIENPKELNDGTILASEYKSRLNVLNRDGSLISSFDLKNDEMTTRAIELKNGDIAFGTKYGYIKFINKKGELKSQYNVGSSITSELIELEDGTIAFASENQHLYVLNPNGALNSKTKLGLKEKRITLSKSQNGNLIAKTYDEIQLLSIKPSDKKKELAVQVKCTEEQLNSPTIPRTTRPKSGSVKQ